MAKVQKTCKCCGKAFTYCPSCNYNEPTYKQLVCSEDCNTIWTALSRNGVGIASAQETIDALAGIKMPATLQPSIKAHIDRLKAEVKPVIKKTVKQQPVEEIKPEEIQKKDTENESPSQK